MHCKGSCRCSCSACRTEIKGPGPARYSFQASLQFLLLRILNLRWWPRFRLYKHPPSLHSLGHSLARSPCGGLAGGSETISITFAAFSLALFVSSCKRAGFKHHLWPLIEEESNQVRSEGEKGRGQQASFDLVDIYQDQGSGSQGQRTVQKMEKNELASHCDMELLKMAMLRHEETFRQQVHELHRLYRVQKQLMGGLSRPSPELSCRRQIRRRRRQPRRALDLHLSAITPPSIDDGLELTLATGSGGGGGRRKRRRRGETWSTGAATPLGSESSDDISGGSLTPASSSTDTGGSPPYQRAAMPPAFGLQEAATTTTVAKQPPRSPWLVQRVSLEMA